MNNYRAILKRVAIVVIVVGILDLLYFFHVVSNGSAGLLFSRGYTSSSTFLVAVGVMFWRGNLRLVPIVTWAAALLFSYFISSLFLELPSKPAELWLTQWNLDPVNLLLSFLYKIAASAVCLWVYIQLRSEPVVRATVKSGQQVSTGKGAFILGVTFVVMVAGIMQFIRLGEPGLKALEIARTQYGAGYKYHVTGISWEGERVRATLIAYNPQQIKPVQVEWSRQSSQSLL
ncbi:MAG: hypothetical protein VKK42_25865 [Lyngbya sp.]|nr:hypothetical protein [Lyngbya sp.]